MSLWNRHGYTLLVCAVGCGTGFDVPVDARRPAEAGAPDVQVDVAMTSDAGANVVDAPFEASCAPESETIFSCTATATTVLAEANYPGVDQIMLDESYVYFNAVGLWRVPKNGGTPTIVVAQTNQGWPVLSAFALGDTYVSWLDYQQGTATTPFYTFVESVPKQSCITGTVATLTNDWLFGVLQVPSSDDVYVFSDGDGPDQNFYRVDTMGVATALTSTPYLSGDLGRSPSGVIYTLTDNVIYQLSGTAWVPFFSSYSLQAETAGPLRFDATNVYFQLCDLYTDAHWLVSVPQTGGATTTIAAANGSLGFSDYTLDGAGHLYATEREPNDVVRMNTDGSEHVILATGGTSGNPVEQAIGIAVDDTCVYWGSADGEDDARNHVYATPK
jgi:hypothetical protein